MQTLEQKRDSFPKNGQTELYIPEGGYQVDRDQTDLPNLDSPVQTKKKTPLKPSVFQQAESTYFNKKKPSGRAGMVTRHIAVSRRALGAHNY